MGFAGIFTAVAISRRGAMLALLIKQSAHPDDPPTAPLRRRQHGRTLTRPPPSPNPHSGELKR